jgi:hypothetical protein
MGQKFVLQGSWDSEVGNAEGTQREMAYFNRVCGLPQQTLVQRSGTLQSGGVPTKPTKPVQPVQPTVHGLLLGFVGFVLNENRFKGMPLTRTDSATTLWLTEIKEILNNCHNCHNSRFMGFFRISTLPQNVKTEENGKADMPLTRTDSGTTSTRKNKKCV